MITVHLKNPENYRRMVPKISKWRAEMLGADLYWNLAVASDKSFKRACATLKDKAAPMTYAAYEKLSLKELRKNWSGIVGFHIWLSERISLAADVVGFTLLVFGLVWLFWRYILS